MLRYTMRGRVHFDMMHIYGRTHKTNNPYSFSVQYSDERFFFYVEAHLFWCQEINPASTLQWASTYWRHSVKAGRGERREMWGTMAEVDMKRERMLIELQNASSGERALCGAVTRAERHSDMGISVFTDF